MGLKRKLYFKYDLVLTILSIFPTQYALASPAKNWKNDFYENSKAYLQNWNPQGWADWISLRHFIVWNRIWSYLKGNKFRDWKKKKKHFTGIWFRDFSINENQKSHWIPIFLLLIVIKHVTETLISLQQVEICNVLVSISYFTQIFGKREPQTW